MVSCRCGVVLPISAHIPAVGLPLAGTLWIARPPRVFEARRGRKGQPYNVRAVGRQVHRLILEFKRRTRQPERPGGRAPWFIPSSHRGAVSTFMTTKSALVALIFSGLAAALTAAPPTSRREYDSFVLSRPDAWRRWRQAMCPMKRA